MHRIPVWVVVSIVLSGLLAVASIAYRVRVEQRNHAVGLVAEIDVIQELAAAQGIDLKTALSRLKENGLTGVAMSEETVGDLVSSGRVTFFAPSEEVRRTSPVPPMYQGDLWAEGIFSDIARIFEGVRLRFPQARLNVNDREESGLAILSLPDIPANILRRTPVGLDPRSAQAVSETGLDLVGRYSNPAGASERTIVATLEKAKEQGVSVFLPLGEQVLGRRDNLKTASETLQRLGIAYATPEFAKIGGDANVVAMAPENVVRLHSAQAAELDKLPMADAVERYAKAARERNIRLLLLRPVSMSSAEPLASLTEFVRNVRQAIEKDGHLARSPHPFEDSGVPRILLLAVAFAAVPVLFWVGASFVRDRRLQIAGGMLLLLLALASYVDSGRQIMALVAAIGFPTAAFLILDARRGRHWAVEFLVVSAVSLVGGLIVAGLLNELKYFVRADAFAGVKVAHFLPLALIGGWFFWKLSNPRDSLASPVRWGQGVLAIVMLVAFAFMATRTGNDSPAGVSGLELKIRALLDAVLFVRPRTKEFLIGHPLLAVGIVWLIALRAREASSTVLAKNGANGGWVALALMAAAIGQTSIVNTLCHLHTPVLLSLARIGVGLVAGGILGALLVWMLSKVPAKDSAGAATNEGG